MILKSSFSKNELSQFKHFFFTLYIYKYIQLTQKFKIYRKLSYVVYDPEDSFKCDVSFFLLPDKTSTVTQNIVIYNYLDI